MKARLRAYDFEDSHLRAGREALIDSHKRRRVEHRCAPYNIQHRGSIDNKWTRDPYDEPVVAVVEDV